MSGLFSWAIALLLIGATIMLAEKLLNIYLPKPPKTFEFMVTECYHEQGKDGGDLIVSHKIKVPEKKVQVEKAMGNSYYFVFDPDAFSSYEEYLGRVRPDEVYIYPVVELKDES